MNGWSTMSDPENEHSILISSIARLLRVFKQGLDGGWLALIAQCQDV